METFLKFRWLVAAVVILITLGVGTGLEHAAEPDNALTVWFLETDPQLRTYEEFHDQFGNDEVVLVHLRAPDGVFRVELLQEIRDVSGDLEALTGVGRVHSVVSVQDAWDTEEGLVFRELVPDPVPEEPAELEAAARRTMQNPLFQGRLVDSTGEQTLLWVEMAVMDDFDAMRDTVVASVRETLTDHFGAEGFAMGGVGVVYSGLNVLTQHDFGIFLGICYLVMFLLMWWIFRQWRIVVAAMGVITVGTVVCLGVYGLMGHQINMVTVVLPILVIVLGIADAVHMPANYLQIRRREPGLPAPELVKRTLRHVLLPSILTTLTTMGSFLALTSSPMAVIRELGLYSALGIGAALVATISFMTIALHGLKDDYEPPEHRRLRDLLERVREVLIARPVPIALALGLTTIVALGLATRVDADTYTIGYLPDDNEVVLDHERITEEWGFYASVEFVVRPEGGRTVQDAEVLAAMDAFVARSKEHPLISQGFSLADIYRRTAAVFMTDDGEEVEAFEGELSAEQVDQLSLLLSMQSLRWDRGHPEFSQNFLAPLMSEEGDLGRITLTGSMESARVLETLFDALLAIGEEEFAGLAAIEVAGYPPLYVRIIEYVISSKVRGFFIALGVIFFMLLVGLRSLRLALVGLPANVFPVAVMLGVMGALGIDLDVATATVGAIVIGIAIDDSVHFLHHWKVAEGRGLSWEGALEYAYRHAGKAALVTTILILGGFPVLMLAGVKTVVYFGLLTSVAAIAALAADLLLLPLMLKWWPPRRTGGPRRRLTEG